MQHAIVWGVSKPCPVSGRNWKHCHYLLLLYEPSLSVVYIIVDELHGSILTNKTARRGRTPLKQHA